MDFSGDKKACFAPPQVDYAAVVSHDYQDRFDERTTVRYKCMESYEMSGSSSSTCINGKWSAPGVCGKEHVQVICLCVHVLIIFLGCVHCETKMG